MLKSSKNLLYLKSFSHKDIAKNSDENNVKVLSDILNNLKDNRVTSDFKLSPEKNIINNNTNSNKINTKNTIETITNNISNISNIVNRSIIQTQKRNSVDSLYTQNFPTITNIKDQNKFNSKDNSEYCEILRKSTCSLVNNHINKINNNPNIIIVFNSN